MQVRGLGKDSKEMGDGEDADVKHRGARHQCPIICDRISCTRTDSPQNDECPLKQW